MQKFIIILSNNEGMADFNNPMELMGTDKNDIRNAVAENTPPEFINYIFTVQTQDFVL